METCFFSLINSALVGFPNKLLLFHNRACLLPALMMYYVRSRYLRASGAHTQGVGLRLIVKCLFVKLYMSNIYRLPLSHTCSQSCLHTGNMPRLNLNRLVQVLHVVKLQKRVANKYINYYKFFRY